MVGTLVRVDSLPVAAGTATAFYKLKAGFESAFPGITLHVYSGYRSYEEQKAIFLSRYVPVGQVNGRRVYDYRRWNGVLYARISGEGTVAVPGASNHGDGRALDIRDSGASAGVTRYGNARSAWIRANASKYDFDPDGYRDFNEPWHIRYTGDQWKSLGSPSTSTPSNPSTPVTTGDPFMKILRNSKDGGTYIVGPRRIKHLGSVADVRSAEKTFGGQINLTDNEFRIALIGFNVPYSEAKKNADWQK